MTDRHSPNQHPSITSAGVVAIVVAVVMICMALGAGWHNAAVR